jgi:cytochrome bd ubiquinol oxidase subunit II
VLHDRAQKASAVIGAVAILVTFGFMTWIHVGLSTGFVPKPIEAIGFIAVIGAAWAAREKAEGWAFTGAALGIAGAVGALFSELYPRVLVSSTNTSYNLTIANTASPSYTLRVMTVVAAVFFPIVIVYQAWSYHVFRRRLSVPRVGSEEDTKAATSPAAPSTPAETS